MSPLIEMSGEEIERFKELYQSAGLQEAMWDFLKRRERGEHDSSELDWFESGVLNAQAGCERDRPPICLRMEGSEADLAKWLAGYDQTRASIEEDDRAPSKPVNWYELGAKAARRGLTHKLAPLELRERGRENDLAEFFRGFDETRASINDAGSV